MENEQLTFEFAHHPTIKGFPELRWTGKRPFTSTQYFPAQLKETYGEPDEETNWTNKIFWGDNLQVMSHLLKEYRGKIDLIYIDPPFDSKADYKKRIDVKGVGKAESDITSFEEKQYGDIWTNDEYLQFMYERLTLMRELLSDKGSLFLHCDWRKSHHLRIVLDEVFGVDCFRACISWRAMTSSGYKGKSSLGRSHADILYYSKSPSGWIYNPYYLPLSDNMLKRYTHEDPDGRKFKDSNLGNVTQATIDKLKAEDLLYITSNGTPRIKHYLDEAEGIFADDVWTDINTTNSQANNQTGYPTQKPEALLERIISISSNPGDLVFDCFMGSGTTQAVSMKLGRRFIGADINLGSIQTTTKRLATISNELKFAQHTLSDDNVQVKKYTSFEVYNVNNYDFFRNPIEAKNLVIDALEIQAFPQGNLWDGELNGRMVKIMPVNRIATKADLANLVHNMPFNEYDKRKESNPNEPVESITIVCMGHEPDLKAGLVKELSQYNLDVQVFDILHDKKDLQLKRESEAEIVREGDKLVIREFYPMNLMQKLSLQKDYFVDDWRQLVDSIIIDWNYDGVVMQPVIMDIPDKKSLVKGIYDIPDDAGIIRIKITDLLSESLEMEV